MSSKMIAVSSLDLCFGCGTCVGVCPVGALKMIQYEGLLKPSMDKSLCLKCGLCELSCPGINFRSDKLKKDLFGKKCLSNKNFGNYISIYVGHACDDRLRYTCTSGGLVTQLLIHALNSKLIDGVIVTRLRKDSPFEPETFVARTVDEVMDASKSKYCPVSTNVCLKEVLKEEKRFALVGLPCHINGLRKAQQYSSDLKRRIVLTLGLFCDHSANFYGSYFILEKIGLKKEAVASISYRGYGWPGYMLISLKNGAKYSIPYSRGWNSYWPLFASFFFTPLHCTMCRDFSSELADVSFGDAWLPENKNEQMGVSLIIVRSEKGQSFISDALSANTLYLKSIKEQKMLKSVSNNIIFKKNDFSTRLLLLQNFSNVNCKMFVNELVASKVSVFSLIRSLFVYFGMAASASRFFKALLCSVPFSAIRLYYGFYKIMCKL